jgi:CO/xanthine dehydrogenase Mo-binding subunit
VWTRFKLAMAADGRLLGFRADVRVDMGAYARTNGARLPLLAVEELPGPYAWDAFAATAEGFRTTTTPIGSVRAPLALEQTFARERAIDRAARELGLDPVDVRRRSLITALPYVRRYGGDLHHHTYEGGDYPAALDALVTQMDELRAERDRRRADGETVGVGLGLFLAHSGLGSDERVHLELARGRFTVVTAASDVGQGLDRMATLVAAAALRVEPGAVEVRSGAVHAAAMTRGTFSSRGTVFVGNAVRDACSALEGRARERLADEMGAALDEVEPAPGGFRIGARHVPWTAAGELEAAGRHHADEAVYGVGGHVALVRVDRELGEIAVERLAVVYDCGRAIDPLAVRDQLAGGSVHGVGIALQEALRFDDAAQPLTVSFMDYLPPGAAEAPELGVAVLEHGTAQNPLGVKGTGEAGVIGVGAAVANAVADAAGIDLVTLPLEV